MRFCSDKQKNNTSDSTSFMDIMHLSFILSGNNLNFRCEFAYKIQTNKRNDFHTAQKA